MHHGDPVERSGGRHRKARHRAPSAFERRRDRTLDLLADVVDVLPSGRTLTAGAVGGVLVAGGIAAGAPAVGSSPAETTTGLRPLAAIATPLVSAQRVSDTVLVAQTEERKIEEVQAKADGQARAVEREKAEEAARRKAAAEAKAERERKEALENADPRVVAKAMLADFGWDAGQFSCLDRIWTQESGWRVDAANPSSGAYGIPQALPGTKMASAGGDWRTNPATQIRWGLGYIQDRYGSPCGAWDFKKGAGWY